VGPGPEALHLAATVMKSVQADRSPGATQRASSVSQEQIAQEGVAALDVKKTDALEHLRREKIRQERERRRRNMERHALDMSDDADQQDGESHLDLIA